MRAMRGGGKKPPALMDPTRERDPHRILALFTPYRARLIVVLVMIVASAGVSMINPFLLVTALNTGIIKHDSKVLGFTVLGMIGVALFSNATSVWQTYLSNVVGQRVMHDLRTAVYGHLQRMSLAFFTRTRTGEVQSRIANDIGGLDAVVTTTATTIASNATTVIAALVAMMHPGLAPGAVLADLHPAVGVGDPPDRPDPPQDHHPPSSGSSRTCPRWSRSRSRSRASCSARRWAAAPIWLIASPASPSRSPTSRSAAGWPAAG